MKVAILGRGAWGTALATHVAQAHRVHWWGRRPASPSMGKSVTHFDQLPAAIDGCDWVVLATPVPALGEIAQTLQSCKSRPLLWSCKGMDPTTGLLPGEILEATLGPSENRAVLSGPSFADELAQGLPSAAVVAAATQRVAEQAAAIFHHGTFRIYASEDLVGVQLGGAIKNVLAIAAGIAAGLKLGDNTRAALITRGLHELIQLGQARGARPETLHGLSGLGDIVLSCSGPHSRNFQLGQYIGEGLTPESALHRIGQTVEGYRTAEALYQFSEQQKIELPICHQVHRILQQQIEPREAVAQLLARTPRLERE